MVADADSANGLRPPQESLPQVRSALSVPGSRALVIGTANYSPGSGLLAVEAAGPTAADVGRVLVERCGLAEAGLRVEVDLATPTDMGVALAEEAERASGVLLFYYVGHGLVSMEGELFLASCVTDGRPAYLRHTALAYGSVRSTLLASGAQSVVVVLDCCFSGRALTSLSDSGDESALAAVHGGYVLTAAAREESALAPPGQRHTAFSGELIRLLTEGDEHGEAYIRLRDVYQYLSQILPARGFPRPRCQAREDIDRLILAPNPAHRPLGSPSQQRARPVSEGEPDQSCPYPGVDAFTAERARYFFGRERLTTELSREVTRAQEHPGPVVLAGVTASGKSSLLGAGVLGALRQRQEPFTGPQPWPYAVFRPGVHPVAMLAGELAMLTGLEAGQLAREFATDPVGAVCRIGHALDRWPGTEPGGSGRLLVMVDQFEETFTDCSDEQERRLFTKVLLRLADGGNGQAIPASVLLGIRSEYEGHLTVDPELASAVRERRLVVPGMSASELRSVIEGPAEIAGLTLEPGLADTILDQLDVDRGDDLQPGELGVLAHALHATWRKRVGRMMTIHGFETTGGIPGAAVAVAAERAYRSQDVAGRQAAKFLVLSLIDISDPASMLRRRVPVDQLRAEALAPSALDAALKAFADAGSITLAGGTAELDGLLRQGWPRLGDWVEADRGWLPAYDRIFAAAMAWNGSDRDPSGLFRSGRLAVALNEAANLDVQEHMGPLTRRFLDASVSHERRVRRRRTAVVAVLAVMLILTVTLSIIAIQQRNIAIQQRKLAIAAQQVALHQRSLAMSGQVTAEANEVQAGDPQLAVQLAAVAYDIAPTAQAAGAVLEFGSSTAITALSQGPVTAAALSPDGRTLATADSDGRVGLWSITGSGRLTSHGTLPASNGHTPVTAMAFSPDGRTLVAAGGGQARLWNLATAQGAAPIDIQAMQITAVAVSPDGKILALVGSDGTIRLFDVATRQQIGIPLLNSTTTATVAAFSPEGNVLAVGDLNGVVTFWDIFAHSKTASIGTGDGGVMAVEFSPSGKMLAIGGNNHATQLWSAAGPVRLSTLVGDTGVIRGVAFSPDGESLATANLNGTTRLWDISSPRHPSLLALATASSRTTAVAVGPSEMITVHANRTVSIMSTSLTQARARLCAGVRLPISRSQWSQYVPYLGYNPPCKPLGMAFRKVSIRKSCERVRVRAGRRSPTSR